MKASKICLSTATLFLLIFSVVNAYSTGGDPRLGRDAAGYEESSEQQENFSPTSSRMTGQIDYTGAGEQIIGNGYDQQSVQLATQDPSQVIQALQAGGQTGPLITKEEVQAELELVKEELREAEVAKGGPLNKKDLEKLEEKLEHEPWYRRLTKGVSKFFKGTLGGRSKRTPVLL